MKGVKEKNAAEADTEAKKQLDLALLRMTEKKIQAETQVKELQQALNERDDYILQLETMLGTRLPKRPDI